MGADLGDAGDAQDVQGGKDFSATRNAHRPPFAADGVRTPDWLDAGDACRAYYRKPDSGIRDPCRGG